MLASHQLRFFGCHNSLNSSMTIIGISFWPKYEQAHLIDKIDRALRHLDKTCTETKYSFLSFSISAAKFISLNNALQAKWPKTYRLWNALSPE